MLTSLTIIFLLGLILGGIFNKLKLPSLLGMIITGIILSPNVLNLLDPSLLAISVDLRQIALIIILARAGLSLDINDLKKVGRPAILMCFIPATFEMIGIILVAPKFLNISVLDAAIMGAVLAAVSPAVVVPRMIKIMDEGYGKNKGIPQLILAGASVDDVYVIVIFTSLISMATSGDFNFSNLFQIPISIIFGILVGIILGIIFIYFFKKVHIRDSIKIVIIFSVSGLLLELENILKGVVPFSGLIAVMAIGITIYQKYNVLAERLSSKYSKLWVAAEILLFVLVGATVDINYAFKSGLNSLLIVIIALFFRMIGVYLSLLKTNLSNKEKLFCMLAYTPKATVQAAIGSIPLSLGLASGQQILTVAVIAIMVTAPFGAIWIDYSYKKLLKIESESI